jgi:hypothetical protein
MLSVVLLNVSMLSVVILKLNNRLLSVIMLSVFMLNVVVLTDSRCAEHC